MNHKRLNIAITKSTMKSFSVSVGNDGDIEFNCNLGLCTEAGQEITEVSHSTSSWRGKDLKVTTKAYKLAGELAKELHECTEEHVRNLQNLLTTSES